MKPHPYYASSIGDYQIARYSNALHRLIFSRALPLTYTQGGREWFIIRKFSLTASQAEKHLNLAFKDRTFVNKPHWCTIAEVIKYEKPSPFTETLDTPDDVRDWALQAIDNIEFCNMVADYDGYTKLLPKQYKDALLHVSGQTSLKKPTQWCSMDPKHREFFDKSLTQLKKLILERVPNTSPEYG